MNTEYEFEALKEARNYRVWIKDLFSAHITGTTVEIGAGIGQNTGEYLNTNSITKLICVEPETKFIKKIVEKYPQLNVIEGTIQNLPPDIHPNTIISINVLEHIKEDREELKKYSEKLSHLGGSLCLLVPARMELYSQIDNKFGHYRRYTKKGLTKILISAGFTAVNVKYINTIGYLTWLINFKFLKRCSFTKTSVKAFDRIIIPPLRVIERFFPAPIGQSLVAIAKIEGKECASRQGQVQA